MKRYEVTFSCYTGSESASDTFHFADAQAARDKVSELRNMIEHNFLTISEAEIVDEPGFFGIRDPRDGSFARVTFDVDL
ncbi:MAG: hypothetical protein IKR25_00590 [Muribaculaceae bacterium]|nr:hypothetical protein [Muribaculaceae bacterium]